MFTILFYHIFSLILLTSHKTENTMNIQSFYIIGISVRTTNENNQAGKDISELWNTFLSQNIIQKIPNKIGGEVYSVYTDYEKDYTKPYTTILGCKVSSLDSIPQGMIGKTISGGNYKKYLAKGSLKEGIVYKEWEKIWKEKIKRTYTADFEVYGEKSQNPENAEVEIFIAVK